jgi:hypothetical protein
LLTLTKDLEIARAVSQPPPNTIHLNNHQHLNSLSSSSSSTRHQRNRTPRNPHLDIPLSAAMGSILLPHLQTGWHVDQAILSEPERLVVIRFGRDGNEACMKQDDVLARIADKVKNFAVLVCVSRLFFSGIRGKGADWVAVPLRQHAGARL